MKENKFRTDFLLPKKSFWTGVASILDIGGGNTSQFNTSESGELADLKAIESDWHLVGKDFYIAIEKLTKGL